MTKQEIIDELNYLIEIVEEYDDDYEVDVEDDLRRVQITIS